MPVSCRNLGFQPFFLAENGDDMNDSIKANASFRIMDENDVCFHYFHLSIHKLPDDEIVLFGCFIGWSGFSWMVFRFSNKKHLRTPTSFEKCLDVRIQFKVHQTHCPMPRFHWCYQLVTNIHLQQKPQSSSWIQELRLGWFFCGGCGQQGWDWQKFLVLLESTISFSPQIC